MITRCAWTGAEFAAVKRWPHPKKFASASAKTEAHKAARLYTEHMIEQGFLTWDAVRRWYDGHRNGENPSCTTPAPAERPGPMADTQITSPTLLAAPDG